MVVAVVGNKAIFFGGISGSYSAQIDIYDNQSNSWTTHTTSQARRYAVVAVVGNKAIFLGGDTGHGRSAKIDIYNAASDTWRAVDMSSPFADIVGTRMEKNKAVFIGPDSNRNEVKKYTYLGWG